jgi:hypothetical protein
MIHRFRRSRRGGWRLNLAPTRCVRCVRSAGHVDRLLRVSQLGDLLRCGDHWGWTAGPLQRCHRFLTRSLNSTYGGTAQRLGWGFVDWDCVVGLIDRARGCGCRRPKHLRGRSRWRQHPVLVRIGGDPIPGVCGGAEQQEGQDLQSRSARSRRSDRFARGTSAGCRLQRPTSLSPSRPR